MSAAEQPLLAHLSLVSVQSAAQARVPPLKPRLVQVWPPRVPGMPGVPPSHCSLGFSTWSPQPLEPQSAGQMLASSPNSHFLSPHFVHLLVTRLQVAEQAS